MRAVFPTTIWTTIRQAGANDREALEAFAVQYREPVRRYLRGRGFSSADAEDLCHEVFVRLLEKGVLERADAARGRFRALLQTIASRVATDRLRKRREDAAPPNDGVEVASGEVEGDAEFDRAWALHLTERALERMRDRNSPYHAVLSAHLSGQKQDRNKLWIARRQLSSLIRDEVAQTCTQPEDLEEELAYLQQFLRPRARD